MILFFSEDIQFPHIKKRITKQWIQKIAVENKKKIGKVSIIFCSDSYLLKLNKKYLKHNYFTDIITFNYNHLNLLNGDIFISLETIAKNASIYNVTVENELFRVIIHGILHLIGYDDKTNEQKKLMKMMEDSALFEINKMIVS